MASCALGSAPASRSDFRELMLFVWVRFCRLVSVRITPSSTCNENASMCSAVVRLPSDVRKLTSAFMSRRACSISAFTNIAAIWIAPSPWPPRPFTSEPRDMSALRVLTAPLEAAQCNAGQARSRSASFLTMCGSAPLSRRHKTVSTWSPPIACASGLYVVALIPSLLCRFTLAPCSRRRVHICTFPSPAAM